MPGSFLLVVLNTLVGYLIKGGFGHSLNGRYDRGEMRDIVSDLRYRVQNMINGQWWLTIPKWVYIPLRRSITRSSRLRLRMLLPLGAEQSTKRNRVALP